MTFGKTSEETAAILDQTIDDLIAIRVCLHWINLVCPKPAIALIVNT